MSREVAEFMVFVVEQVARYGTSYEKALDCLYRSDMLKGICEDKTTLSTWAPQDLLDRYESTEREPVCQGARI